MIIATDETVNNIKILDCDKDITIHTAPKMSVLCGKPLTNFDFYIDFDGKNKEWKGILGARYIDSSRIPKTDQFDALCKYGINVPRYVYSNNNNNNNNNMDINDYVGMALSLISKGSDEQIVLKVRNGARGLGQCVMTIGDLAHFISEYVLTNGDVTKLDKEKYQLGGDKDDEMIKRNWFYKEPIIIQELVKVKKEYRLLFNHTGICDIVERTVNAQAGFQSNGQINKPFERTRCAFWDEIERFIISTGLLFGSIDVYLDENDKYGVFEYCPQFAYVSHDPLLVHEMIKSSIDNLEPLKDDTFTNYNKLL